MGRTREPSLLSRSACSAGHLEIVKLLVGDKVPMPHKVFYYACEGGRTSVVEWLLKFPEVLAVVKHEDDLFLRLACSKGYTEIARLLLDIESVDPMAAFGYPLRSACEYGRSEIVSILLRDPRVDPLVKDNYCLRVAFKQKHQEVVKLLLTDHRVNPVLGNALLILMARDLWNLDNDSPFTGIPFELSSKIVILMMELFIDEIQSTGDEDTSKSVT